MANPAGPLDQQRLLREARRYEALIAAEGSIVWVLDPSMRPTGRNTAWETYTGQRHEDYAHLGWLSAVHPDDRDRLQLEARHAMTAGLPFSTEIRIRRLDGLYHRHVIRALPIRDGEAIVEWIGTATDVEDSRQTADEQRDLRSRLLALTDGAERVLSTRSEAEARRAVLDLAERVLPGDAHAIWWLDVARSEWRIVQSRGLSDDYVARTAPGDLLTFSSPLALEDLDRMEMLDGRREAYIAEGIQSMLTVPLPIGGRRRAMLVAYHRSAHAITEIETRVGTALGQIAAAALWNAEVYDALQQARLSAERQADRMAFLADASALLGSLEYETTLSRLAWLAVPGIADWCTIDLADADGRLQRVVTAHIDPAKIELSRTLMTRYPLDPAGPTGAPNVMRTGRHEFYPAITDAMLVAGARDEEHVRILRALGIHSVLQAPLTARGITFGVITFVCSNPERPLSEDDVTILTEVGRRAGLAIDNARLYRDAEAANRAKDEFLAVLSHELRTPLNAIMGWSHMLRDGLPDEMVRHAIDVIGRNARSQKQLVEDLLDVVRLVGGRLDLQPDTLDVRDTARAAVDSALPSAQARDVSLALAIPDESIVVRADANRLQQVFANLLSNAVKFTEAGGRITVTVTREEERAEIVVRDTGIGISPDFLPRMFERFRQADPSLTRAYSGLGIGLWIVRRIVEAHGGDVAAHSDGAGTGTTVTVRLPLAGPAD